MAAEPTETKDSPRRFNVTTTQDRAFSKEYIAQLAPGSLQSHFPDTKVGDFLLIRNSVNIPQSLREADAAESGGSLDDIPAVIETELHTPIQLNTDLDDDDIGLDFTLRTALGAPSQLEVVHGEAPEGRDVEIAAVSVEPIDNPENKSWRRWLNRRLGVRPQVCRVRMGVFPDLEDKVCRLPKNTMDLIGVEEGENVVVESTRGNRIVRGIKAFEIDEERKAVKEQQKQDRRRYPSCEDLLGLQQIRRTEVDIPEIWIDEEARVELGLQNRYKNGVCQPVRVYRDTWYLFGQMLHQFAIPLVVVMIAAGLDFVNTYGPPIAAAVWLAAILVWAAVLIVESRSRLS